MKAKYRLVTTWPEDSVQVRDRTSNEILVEMKPHELVTMKHTFDQAREALKSTVATLVAAISLLERGGKAAKKAAPSDKMFDQMIRDYKNAVREARQALAAMEGQP